MAKNLVIVESPAKAKTIEKYLGEDFQVESSFGHIADLPSKEIGIDVEGDFKPKYTVSSDKKAVVKVSSSTQKGLIYGAVSLAQTVINLNGNIVMRRADVVDYPMFSRRIFNATHQPNHLKNDLDWMVRYKIETIGFHNKDW